MGWCLLRRPGSSVDFQRREGGVKALDLAGLNSQMFVPEIASVPVPTYQPDGVFVPFVPMALKFSVRLSPVIGMRPLIEGLMERLRRH